jgi:putative N6-adenine-specific DNA methylase
MEPQNEGFEYETTATFFGQIAGGLEEYGARELAALGAEEITPAYRGVQFRADKETLYRVNYESRLFSRFLAPVLRFSAASTTQLYEQAQHIAWQRLMRLDDTFAITANVSHSKITHSQYAALKLKDAIVDQFRSKTGRRPNVDKENPDVAFNLYIEKNQAVVSFDTSGGPLHRRAYRKAQGLAPMQETLAAAIVQLTEWDGETRLLDPMCGSGTLLAEAVMQHCRIPAGYLRRRFGFESMPDFDPELWQKVRDQADSKIRPLRKKLIFGSDKDAIAIKMAKRNLASLPGGENVALMQQDFRRLPELKGITIVTNPPYGIRMGESDEVRGLYRRFGDFLKQRCTGSTAWIFCGDRSLVPAIGLRTSRKIPLKAAALDGRLVKLELY